MMKQNDKAQATSTPPSIDHIVAGLAVQFKDQTRFIIDSRISETFSHSCPVCGEPASKVKLTKGKTAYVHNVLIRDGVAARADYHPEPRRREHYFR